MIRNGYTIEPAANLCSADLDSANLDSANLRSANLDLANLHLANLHDANFSNVNLSKSTGIVWAQIGPIGTDARTLTAVWHGPEEGVIFHAGCFRGTPTQFREHAESGGGQWDWPEDHAVLLHECLAAADWCESRVRFWLEAIEAQANK